MTSSRSAERATRWPCASGWTTPRTTSTRGEQEGTRPGLDPPGCWHRLSCATGRGCWTGAGAGFRSAPCPGEAVGFGSSPPEEVTASLRHEGCTSSSRFLGRCCSRPRTGHVSARGWAGGAGENLPVPRGAGACLGDPVPSPGSTAADLWKHSWGLTGGLGTAPGPGAAQGRPVPSPRSPPHSTSLAPAAPAGPCHPMCRPPSRSGVQPRHRV